MATNIEQIFRSFVVNKFKEIQEETRNSENMDSAHNGELTAPGTEDASEGSSVITQNEGSSQTVVQTEDTESKPMEIVNSPNLEVEKESGLKELKTTDLSSDDEVKRDSTKKKSKKHKKHKSKKKKKKKKKEKNEKRSKSTSSVEDQEIAITESKSVWKPVISSPKEQDKISTLSSPVEENVDALPSLGVQDHNVDSVKEHPARPPLDIDSGFFGPKCPNEMHFSVSSTSVCEVEPEPSKSAINCQQKNENIKCTDENNEKHHTNCETTEAPQNEVPLPQPGFELSEGKSVQLEGSKFNSEENKDPKQSDNTSSLPLQPQSKSISASLLKPTAKSRSRSNSSAKEIRSRSKSLTKVPKRQTNSKSLTRQRSRSSSVVRRQRSRSSSVGQRRRSKSKSPVRRRRSRSSTPVRYSKSPIRSWWSKSIRNRQRSVSIERRRRSRTRSLARRRRSRSRSSEKGHHSRTTSSAKRRSRSRSVNRRRNSRSTSHKRRLRSSSASLQKSKSAKRTLSKSSSPSRKRNSKSASPLRRRKSKTSSPVRRHRSVQKRRSRSVAASRRHKSRSGSGSRRRKSRSGSLTKRCRSGSASRRHRSRSPSAPRRRRSRSPSAPRRRRLRSASRRSRSRSPSAPRRRRLRSASRRSRSRSPSASRRRRSRSASRRRRVRSPSASRRRRSRSASRGRRSRSASRRRRLRSPSFSRRRRSRSASRRRRSRSPSASRRRRSRSASRRRRSRSASRRRRSRSASRRRRSRSASRKRRSRSPSASRRRRSRSASRRRRSRSASRRRRSGSASRRRRSRSASCIQRQKSRSFSATKRKSRSTSVARREQSTLLSSASKVQSREDGMSSSLQERRSRSKGRDQISRPKSVENELLLQSKSSSEQRVPETMSLDEKQLSMPASTVESFGSDLSTVEKHDEIKLPDTSSTSVTESNTVSSPSRTSSPVAILIPRNVNAIEVESHNIILDCSSTTSLLGDPMKCTYSKGSTEQIMSSNIPFNEKPSIECDMDIEQTTPIQSDCTEQPAEVASMVETSKETFEVDNTNDTKVVDLRIANEPEQKTLGRSAEDGTVWKPFGSSQDLGQLYGLSQPPLEDQDPTSSLCPLKPIVESKPDFANKGSDSVCTDGVKAREHSADDIAASPSLKLSSTDSLPNRIDQLQDSESIKFMKNADCDVPKTKYLTRKTSISSVASDPSSLTVKHDIPVLLAENQMESLLSASAVAHNTSEEKSNVSPVTSNKALDLLYNKQESNMMDSLSSNEGQSIQVLDSPSCIFPVDWKHTVEDVSASTLDEQFSNQKVTPHFKSSTLDEDNSNLRSESKNEVLEASQSEADLQEMKLKPTGEQNVSQPIENMTLEVKSIKENKQTLSSMHFSEDLGSTFQDKESNNSPHEMTLLKTSEPLKVDNLNVHSLVKGENSDSTTTQENSASTIAVQHSTVSPNADYYEHSRSEEPPTLAGSSMTNFSASPRKLCSKNISKENPEHLSVSSATKEMSVLTDLTEDKMEIQRHEVLSDTNNTESSSDCKPSPFNNIVDSHTKQEVDKFLYSGAAQSESSADSIPSSDREVILNAREENSITVPCEKLSSSTSKIYDGNLESVHLGIQEKESSQNIVTSRHTQAFSVSNDSQNECLAKSKDKIHLNAVNENSEEKNIKSCTQGSSPSLCIQQNVMPKNEKRAAIEESSIQSLTEVMQPELETQKQSGPNNSKPKPAYSGFKESKPQEDPKLSPKPVLHETGRLSVTSVPVQFKFSKTIKTLGISQLCSTSEDSSDVENSKVNTSSSSVMQNSTASTSDTPRSSSRASLELSAKQTVNVSVDPSKSSQDVSIEPPQSERQPGQTSEKDLSQPDNLEAADDSQTGSNTKHTFPHVPNAVSKLGVKQRQYRSRSVAQDSRTPSEDRGRASRSCSKSRRRRSHSKSSSRKKRSQSTTRKKSSHSKSSRKKRSRSRSRGRKRRSRSKSKGKKKRSTSKLSGKRKRSRSKSSERIGGSKSSGKQRSSRSVSKTRKNRLQSKSPEKKGRSRSKSEARKNVHSKSTKRRSQSKSQNRRRKSRSKSLSSKSRSRSMSKSRKHFSHSKSSLHRKRSHSSSRSASLRRRSRSRNKRHSFSRSPAARSNSRSRSRWRRSRSRGRWRRSRSLSTSRRRSRSTSRLSSSLSTKKRKSLSPVRRRRSRSQIKQKDKSPLSKRKSASPPPLPPQKKSAQSKPAGFKHSIGLKSLIQKQLSQAKSQGSTGKLSTLSNLTSRTQLLNFSTRAQVSRSNLSNIGQIPVPNLDEVPLPSVSAGSQVPMPLPPSEPLAVSSLAAETQLSVPDLTTANQWHVPDMSSGAHWSVPDIAAGAQWSMTDLGAGTQWPMSDLTAGSHWPMHDLTVGAQWSMPDLAAGTQWAVPDVATAAQWAVPDLAAGTQWTVPDLTAGSQWAMTNMAAGAQWAVPDLAATAQWTVPDLTAGAQMQRADLALEAQVPGSDLAPEAQVPGSDLAAEAQVPGSDLAAEAQVPGYDIVAEAQVPPEHDLASEEHNVMPDVAAEALVPVASSTVVPDVAAGIPLPDVAAAAQMPVPDVAATIHMPDVATEAQKQMSDFVATQGYVSLSPKEPVEDSHFGEPVVVSEYQIESDSCNAFEQQSSSEPSVTTSQLLEETSMQQLPLDSLENSQYNELNEKTISLAKHDLLANNPDVEPAMDCQLNSETCRSSDVPFASCESSDYSVHSISVEPVPAQESSLSDCHKSPDDNSLQFEPNASSCNFFVESQSSPIQPGPVEPSDDCDQPQLAVTDTETDNNLLVTPYNSSNQTPMEEPCYKQVAPYISPDNILQNEPSVNSTTTVEITSHSISDRNEIEACTPNLSQQAELNSSPGHPHVTDSYASQDNPQLVEQYTSPDHPQLVEPYTSPVHPQLVEPYTSPQHPPLVELYSSPDRPQLVEPYASPDFPQLVEPYASPDRQQPVEPCSDTPHAQVCQPCISPDLTENTRSSAEIRDECSISGHLSTYATSTEIHTDSSCPDGSQVKNDFSQLHEYSVTPDEPKKHGKPVDANYHPQFSDSNNANVSLQEVPCPSLVNAYTLESNQETTGKVLSPTEDEPSTRSHLESSASPDKLLTEHICSSHAVHQDEFVPITDQKTLNSCSSPGEPKLDSSFVTTSQQLLGEQCVADEPSQSKELCSIKEVVQPHEDFTSSEQVQNKLYNMPDQPQENFPSPVLPDTDEQCLNAAHAPSAAYEHPSAEDPMNHPDKNLCIPVLSDTITNAHSGVPFCTVMPSPDRAEKEVTEHSNTEESKADSACGSSDRLLATQVDNLLGKSPGAEPVVLHDSQESCCSSPSKPHSDCPNSFIPEPSSNADHSKTSEYSTKINQSLDQTIKTDDSPSSIVFQSQEFSLDRHVENPLPTENLLPADLNKDKQCLTPDQSSDLPVECMKHKLEDSGECIKTDNNFTTTPPDLLPFDSDQPTDICSEPSSEPVPFNSQPPPELLPYDSEQPANSFLSNSDYSTEQGSSIFHAPPELLPYDTDQPTVLHNQQTEPTGEEQPVYDSTIHHETYKALDLPSVGAVESCGNSANINIHEISEKCEPSNEMVNSQLDVVKEVSSECPIEFSSIQHTFTSETRQEHSITSAIVDCTEGYPSSSCSSTDEPLPAQQLAENVQPGLGSEIAEHLISRGENQTEQAHLLTNISDASEVQSSSSYKLNTTETETSRHLPLIQDEVSEKCSSPKSLTETECPQPQPVSKKTDPISESKSKPEHSRSRSVERKTSRSQSASQNKRSRSKSVTPKKTSHSKSVVKSLRSKSRSASRESNRRSPSLVKRKETTYVGHKRSSRSASVRHRKRSRSSSLSPRKRSRSSSVGRKCHRRRSHSQSRQRRSHSPSITSRRRSRSSSATRKRRSPSPSATRRRRSPSATRRRRSPSPSATRRRRSPSATRRRRSPSTTRRRRSPSATRRRSSPSPSAVRRRRSPSATRRRRSPSAARRRRSRSTSAARRRRSRSTSAARRRRSRSTSAARRRRSRSTSAARRKRSPSTTRRRRSPSPSTTRRRRSPSSSEFRRKRSPSRKRHSHSPSVPRKKRSHSTSVSRRRRSASQRKCSRSPVSRNKRSKSKSPSSKSPTGKQSKSARSRSPSQSEVSRKRKTRSLSSSRDKKAVEKRRKRSNSKDSSEDYYSSKQRRKSRTPPRRKKSRSPVRRASVCKSPVRRRRSRSPIRRKSFSRSPIRRKRSRSRDNSMDSARSPKRLTDLDKAQLLEIAKANAAAMCAKAGVPLPPSLKPVISLTAPAEEKITHRTYGVTIQELTEKCKQIAQSKEDDVIVNKPHDSDDEEEDRPFYNHPFKVSEHKPISFSLLNPSLKPAPKNQVTLTKEFPVSSGSQHRKKESDKVYGEWVPVDKKSEESKDDVFTNTGPSQPVDITSAMNERAVAQTRLTGNPYDTEALFMLNRAQEQIDAWAQSTSIPGQFTGSTGAQVLSAEEISNSGPQAWLKKDQFLKAAPVTGGRGALLMRKMGWREGEGLGRNKEGNVDPILLDFKTDRKGLVADGEKASNKLALPVMKDLSGKHPISALMELCNKKKWSPPEFELVDDTGPEHRKRFLFRVTVNGVLCQPSQPSLTKKLAKATAAAAALQALGALPKESMTSTSNFCSASTSTL